jgi:hypothetical protein
MNLIKFKKMKIENLVTLGDVQIFFNYLVYDLRLNFHIDTPFSDYISSKDDSPYFTIEEAERLDKLMDKAFLICEYDGFDIYELALDTLNGFFNAYKP